MNIEKIELKPYERSISPGIVFQVSINFTKFQEAIINVRGWLESDDQKILGEIKEEPFEGQIQDSIGARGSNADPQFKGELKKKSLVVLLDEKALAYIEKRRMQNKKGSVQLTLNLQVKLITSTATVCPIYEVRPSELGVTPIEINIGRAKTSNWTSLVYSPDPHYPGSQNNMWVISGSGGPFFLSVTEENLKNRIEITVADWLQDYAPKLGLGEYFIVEIPTGEKTIKEAWKHIEQAENCYKHWDTKGAFANCREIGTLLDTKIKEKFGKESFAYEERWGRSYLRFKNMSFSDVASLDLHLEDLKKRYPGDITISKADTEHLLIISKALVKLAEEILD
jgi:hypothetical protein